MDRQKDAPELTTGQQTTFCYSGPVACPWITRATYPTTSFESTWNPEESDTYDVNAGLPVPLDDGTEKYVWGAAGIAYTANKSSGAVTTYHTDGLGSVRALSDSTGDVVQTYQTDEFGVPVPAGTTGSKNQPLQYTGEPRDSTGLVYLRARTYDPFIGRFLQQDTVFGSVGDSQSQNLYSYVGNNPVGSVDPSGHCSVDIAADIAFIAYDVGALAWDAATNKSRALQEHSAALAADAVGAAIPCATGLGIAVRAGKAVGAAQDVTKSA